MSGSSAALVVGRDAGLAREIWSGFVKSGLVELVLSFKSLEDLMESVRAEVSSVHLDVKLAFFLVEHVDDLSIPLVLKRHPELSRVPLIAFHDKVANLTDTDVQTLYDHHVSSVIRLPLQFQDLGKLVLKLDRYWSESDATGCRLTLPRENIFQPDSQRAIP